MHLLGKQLSLLGKHLRQAFSSGWECFACLKSSYFEQKPQSSLCSSVENKRNIPLSSMSTVDDHCCSCNIDVTFDLSETEETRLQQTRKQLEEMLETSYYSVGGIRCLYIPTLVSLVPSRPVQSSPECRFYRAPFWGETYTTTGPSP